MKRFTPDQWRRVLRETKRVRDLAKKIGVVLDSDKPDLNEIGGLVQDLLRPEDKEK